MGRKKYIFNSQTLDYEEYKPSLGKRVRKVVLFFLTAGLLGYGPRGRIGG